MDQWLIRSGQYIENSEHISKTAPQNKKPLEARKRKYNSSLLE